MSYRALIRNGVALAFKLAGDLKTPMLLSKASARKTFDFATGTIPATAPEEYNVDGLFVKHSKKSSQANITSRQVIFKAQVVVDLTVFDRLIDGDGSVWKIDSVISSDGFLTMADVSKEIA